MILSCWALHWCGCAVPCSKLVCSKAGLLLLATSHVNRWTPGHAIATEPHSHSPALAISRGFPLNELRDVVFITVCEGAVQHHSEEERMMGVRAPSWAEIEKLWRVPLSALSVGPRTTLFPFKESCLYRISPLLCLSVVLVPLAFPEQDYSSTVKLKLYLKTEANQGSSAAWNNLMVQDSSSLA